MDKKTLVEQLWHEPPVFFPVAVLFHFLLLVRGIYDLGNTIDINWPSLLWYAVAFVLSIYILLLKRWAAIGYILLSILGILLSYALPVSTFFKEVGTTLFPFDLVFSGLLLFFFKRFR